MKKSINEELNSIKFLFKYKAGKVLSEQEQFESEDVGFEEIDLDEEYDDVDMDTRTPEERERDGLDIDMDTGEDLAPSFDSDGNFLGMVKPNRDGMEVDGDLIENRELEVPVKPGTKTPTKPDKDSPYKPKPGPKKAPKAKMPKWLSFAAIGVNIN
jgi:hypothetical protein